MKAVLCLIVLFAVANAGVLKKPGTKKSDPCNLERVDKIVTKGFQRLYCERLRKDGGLKKKRFLRDYFAAKATRNNYLPRRALKKELRQALPKEAMWARKRLLKLRVQCAKEFKRSLSRDSNPKVSRKEFVTHFKPRLSRKKCLKIKGFKFGKRRSGNKQNKNKPAASTSSKKPVVVASSKPHGTNPKLCPPKSSGKKNGGSGKGKKNKGGKKCNLKKVAKVITRGFQKLYCVRLAKRPTLKKKRFLRNYFRRYQTRNGYLPRRALRKNLRQRLPAKSKALRKRLLKLRARCVRKFKRSLSKDGDVRVTRKDFVRFFKPKIRRSKC